MPADPILDRIVYYSEMSPELAQMALAVARLGQVVWQLEGQLRLAREQGTGDRDEVTGNREQGTGAAPTVPCPLKPVPSSIPVPSPLSPVPSSERSEP